MDDAITRAVRVLNDALARDGEALARLINARVECNEALAACPGMRVGIHDGVAKIGILGLLNAVLGDAPEGVLGARGVTDPRSGRMVRIKEFVDLRDGRVDIKT